MTVVIAQSAASFAFEAADYITRTLEAIKRPARLISLSGGSTPAPVYLAMGETLAGKPKLAESCFWIQTDERLVPADDKRSNQRTIMETLFARLGSAANFFPAPTCLDEKEICQRYFQQLKRLPATIAPPAPISLLILGTGTDGHTASLFPDTDWKNLGSSSGMVTVSSPSQPEARFSLTIERIMSAEHVIFLVSGENKKDIINDIFLNPKNTTPAAYVLRNRPTTWIFSPDALSDNSRQYLENKISAL